MLARIRQILSSSKKNRFLTQGLPFVIFVVGGSFFLKQFSTIRYEFRKGRQLTKEEAAELGFKPGNEVLKEMLEEEDTKDPNEWQNIRGPRPWEDSKTMQEAQRQEIKKKKEELMKLKAKMNAPES